MYNAMTIRSMSASPLWCVQTSGLHAVDDPELLNPEVLGGVDRAVAIPLHLVIAGELAGIGAVVTEAAQHLPVGAARDHPLEIAGVVQQHERLVRVRPEAHVADGAGASRGRL